MHVRHKDKFNVNAKHTSLGVATIDLTPLLKRCPTKLPTVRDKVLPERLSLSTDKEPVYDGLYYTYERERLHFEGKPDSGQGFISLRVSVLPAALRDANQEGANEAKAAMDKVFKGKGNTLKSGRAVGRYTPPARAQNTRTSARSSLTALERSGLRCVGAGTCAIRISRRIRRIDRR